MSGIETGDDPNSAREIDFHHPYVPYDVQLEFMKSVYDVLEQGNGQIGILESPTGTVSATFSFVFAIPPTPSPWRVISQSPVLQVLDDSHSLHLNVVADSV